MAKVKKSEQQQGINKISVSGYKSLYKLTTIEVTPLTVLAGANSSGKSSIMQPLLLLKQTLEASYDPGPLLLNGPNLRFTSAEQLLTQGKGWQKTNQIEISIGFQNSNPLLPHELAVSFKKEAQKFLKIQSMKFFRKDTVLDLYPTMEQEELKELFGTLEFSNTEWIIKRERCFLKPFIQWDEHGQKNRMSSPLSKGVSTQDLENYILHMIHLPGLRGNPERNYPVTAMEDAFPGTFEHYVASMIFHWQTKDPEKLNQLNQDLKDMGLTQTVSAHRLNDTQVELRVGRLIESDNHKKNIKNKNDLVSIADVGFGVSQTLPVLVALLVAQPGQLVYLEQPEIHLHPRAQVALAKILANAANRGVRVVVETHSNLLLLGIQTLIAQDTLAKDKVTLHWFTRNKRGDTTVSIARPDNTGAFGDWPEDFADVVLNAENNYLTAAEQQLRLSK